MPSVFRLENLLRILDEPGEIAASEIYSWQGRRQGSTTGRQLNNRRPFRAHTAAAHAPITASYPAPLALFPQTHAILVLDEHGFHGIVLVCIVGATSLLSSTKLVCCCPLGRMTYLYMHIMAPSSTQNTSSSSNAAAPHTPPRRPAQDIWMYGSPSQPHLSLKSLSSSNNAPCIHGPFKQVHHMYVYIYGM